MPDGIYKVAYGGPMTDGEPIVGVGAAGTQHRRVSIRSVSARWPDQQVINASTNVASSRTKPDRQLGALTTAKIQTDFAFDAGAPPYRQTNSNISISVPREGCAIAGRD